MKNNFKIYKTILFFDFELIIIAKNGNNLYLCYNYHFKIGKYKYICQKIEEDQIIGNDPDYYFSLFDDRLFILETEDFSSFICKKVKDKKKFLEKIKNL